MSRKQLINIDEVMGRTAQWDAESLYAGLFVCVGDMRAVLEDVIAKYEAALDGARGEHEAQHSADSFFVDGEWLTAQEHIIGSEDTQIATIVLPDDIRLCRRVPDDADLLYACESALAMLDELFPADVFTGESGDVGSVLIAENRERLQAAIEKAKGE